jgi:Fe-S-cluster-containing hydrogenase component 2
MDNKNRYLLIQCPECAVWPCAVRCAENAIAFFCDVVMIETAKCTACPDYAENEIPRCVADCGKSAAKHCVEEIGLKEKRINAASALSERRF